MKKLFAVMVLFFFGSTVVAEEMPGTSLKLSSEASKLKATLKDEIEFEKSKLVGYHDALKISKGNKIPLVVCVGCYSDDINLYLQLKGKVIFCYLQSKTAPFPTLESGVVVGLWNADATTCVRHDVSTSTFSDANFRNDLLNNKVVPSPSPLPTTTVETYTLRRGVYYSNTTGLPLQTGQTPWVVGTDCSSGKCVPTYGFR